MILDTYLETALSLSLLGGRAGREKLAGFVLHKKRGKHFSRTQRMLVTDVTSEFMFHFRNCIGCAWLPSLSFSKKFSFNSFSVFYLLEVIKLTVFCQRIIVIFNMFCYS
jgi:hypothetical protein